MNTTANLQVVILAAGKGTRMKSALPKVLHRIAHVPMLAHVLTATDSLKPSNVVLVIAPGMEDVRAVAQLHRSDAKIAIQSEQLGTGHAVKMALPELQPQGKVLVLFGDTPLVTTQTLSNMLTADAPIVVLGFNAKDPTGYGRLSVKSGVLEEIIECREANEQQKKITLCNAGVMLLDAGALPQLLEQLQPRSKGEYYLTDCIHFARKAGLQAKVVEAAEEEVMGINSRAQQAEAEAVMQKRLREAAMENGATLVAPETVFLSSDTKLGKDVTVHPHVVFGPGVVVEDGAEIRSFSHIEGAKVGARSVVGPFARLRPGALLKEQVHVGNFVEIKNSTLENGAKANHLSYVGDASVGEAANIGAGTITCNYDGVAKHKTTIGAGAFIGSNTALVAPVEVGEKAVIGAGSVITENVPPASLALGRGRQVNKNKK